MAVGSTGLVVGSTGRRRRLARVLLVFLALAALLGSSVPAYADPGTDDEGGTATLRQKLEDVAKAYYAAQAALTQSRTRQAEIQKNLRLSQDNLAKLGDSIGKIAAARYKGGELGVLDGLIVGQGTPSTLLQGAAVMQYLVWRDDEALRRYREMRDESQRQQKLLDGELANEQKQLGLLDQQKRAAEKALASVGGMVSAGYTGPSAAAQPAPRNADGSWPNESCNLKDPTSEGCVTPRMYHALNESRLAGFTHYTHCWRSATWGEHPLGRACDFSANASGFADVAATGEDKAYGNRLAAWCMANADALGVIYVIWYRQIWMPGIGWRTYFGTGDPASEHTNHVHLSVI
jgi:hypothetical protein